MANFIIRSFTKYPTSLWFITGITAFTLNRIRTTVAYHHYYGKFDEERKREEESVFKSR